MGWRLSGLRFELRCAVQIRRRRWSRRLKPAAARVFPDWFPNPRPPVIYLEGFPGPSNDERLAQAIEYARIVAKRDQPVTVQMPPGRFNVPPLIDPPSGFSLRGASRFPEGTKP